MMPAIPIGPLSSVTTIVSSFNSTIFSSNNVTFSPTFAMRGRIGPCNKLKSYACSGWPSSSITKLVISTTGEIARKPERRSCSVIQTGDLAVVSIPRTTRPANLGQPAGSTSSTGWISSIVAATAMTDEPFKSVPVNAEISRAIPRTLKQSPRFGVRSRSKIASGRFRNSMSADPTFASRGRDTMPSDSLPRPISTAEHSIPYEATPRIFALRSFRPLGSFTPGLANGAFIPCTTFGAPQTTSINSPLPSSTLHKLSLSASGCLETDTTSAITISAMPSPSNSMPSTS